MNNARESVIAIKGRAGIQSGNALLYVLGGYAMGSGVFETYAVDSGSGLTSCTTSTCASISEDTNGVVIGAGVDWAFRENWIGRFEVQHMTFSDVDAPVLDAGGDSMFSGDASVLSCLHAQCDFCPAGDHVQVPDLLGHGPFGGDFTPTTLPKIRFGKGGQHRSGPQRSTGSRTAIGEGHCPIKDERALLVFAPN